MKPKNNAEWPNDRVTLVNYTQAPVWITSYEEPKKLETSVPITAAEVNFTLLFILTIHWMIASIPEWKEMTTELINLNKK